MGRTVCELRGGGQRGTRRGDGSEKGGEGMRGETMDGMLIHATVDHEEVDRLRKRFMKLDKDNSGTIEREEFLSLPQVSSNPLATR